MPQRPRGERVLGPYPNRSGYRVIYVLPGGTRQSEVFPTLRAAEDHKAGIAAGLEERHQGARTVGEALAAYERHLATKGNKPRSVAETLRRLRRFFEEDQVLAHLTVARARALYQALVDAGLAVDTHRNYLAEARSFLAWCVSRGWARSNALAAVKGQGRRRHGKPQLRVDEARAWRDAAFELARSPHPWERAGALGALLTLYLGLRCSEVVSRVVRDVDDGGRLLWIPDSKTEAGRRTLDVPPPLQALLRLASTGRPASEPLFAGEAKGGQLTHHDRGWPTDWVARICARAGVPRITGHGARGTAASLAAERGEIGAATAAALGHASYDVTEESYATRESVERARQRRRLEVLDGGRKGGGRGKRSPR